MILIRKKQYQAPIGIKPIPFQILIEMPYLWAVEGLWWKVMDLTPFGGSEFSFSK